MIFVRSSVNMLSSVRVSRKHLRFFSLQLGKIWFSHGQENYAWKNSFLAGLHRSTFTVLPTFEKFRSVLIFLWHVPQLILGQSFKDSFCLPASYWSHLFLFITLSSLSLYVVKSKLNCVLLFILVMLSSPSLEHSDPISMPSFITFFSHYLTSHFSFHILPCSPFLFSFPSCLTTLPNLQLPCLA